MRDPVTWDITIRGRMPTQREYDASMRILREIEADGSSAALRRTSEMDPAEYEACLALFQQGLIETYGRTPAPGSREFCWHGVRLTPYGKVYLRQRRET